jgi:outer membrane protein assembly factor BamB
MVFARCGALGFAVLLTVCPPAAHARPAASQSQDSFAYQINGDHTGDITFTGGFSGSLTQLWSVNLNGFVSYPLTAKGLVYVTVGASEGALLDAISLSTGTTVWEKLLPGSSSWADAAYHAGSIFVADGSGQLLAFRASGKPLWSVKLSTSGYATGVTAPAIGDGMVALQYNDYEQFVSAYDELTGANVWTVNPNYSYDVSGISGVPIVTPSGVYVGGEASFYGLSPQDGSTIWSATLGTNPSDSPVLTKVGLFVSDTSCCTQGNNTIFDPTSGSVKGEFAGEYAPVILGKTLIVSLNGILYDYSPDNGNVHWWFGGDGSLYSKPIVINGYVAVLSQQGNLYLLDGSTGAQLWTTALGYAGCCGGGPDTGLGAGEGVLLVPDGNSLYAFGPQHGAKLGSRPEPTRVIGRLINGHFVPD